MKIYKITKVSSLQDIEVQAKDDKEIMQLYYEGVVDEILSTKNDHISYQIEDEDGNLIYGHIYTQMEKAMSNVDWITKGTITEDSDE